MGPVKSSSRKERVRERGHREGKCTRKAKGKSVKNIEPRDEMKRGRPRKVRRNKVVNQPREEVCGLPKKNCEGKISGGGDDGRLRINSRRGIIRTTRWKQIRRSYMREVKGNKVT